MNYLLLLTRLLCQDLPRDWSVLAALQVHDKLLSPSESKELAVEADDALQEQYLRKRRKVKYDITELSKSVFWFNVSLK